ncbi:MAG: hypothetical protein AB9907_02195 [Flexilinea sp.]
MSDLLEYCVGCTHKPVLTLPYRDPQALMHNEQLISNYFYE